MDAKNALDTEDYTSQLLFHLAHCTIYCVIDGTVMGVLLGGKKERFFIRKELRMHFVKSKW